MAKKSSGGTPATKALTKAGIAFTTHAYEHNPAVAAYGLEAAAALGLDPARVFKTLLVELDDSPITLGVGIVPVDKHLDLKAIAVALGAKRAGLCPPVNAERITGYVIGGISPVGQKRQLPTVLADSAAAYDKIYVSGGKRGFDIGIAPEDLIRATGASYAPIAR
ncbi:MAG: Cys-tRNA(Pro) deacylase [Tetrasphaera sp.]